MHRESQAVTLRAFFGSLCDVTHVRTLRADTSDTALLRQQEGQVFQIEVGLTWGSLLEEGCEELRIVVLLIHQVLDDTAVDVTSTSTHHKAFAGGQAHRGIDTLPVEYSCHRSSTADVSCDDLA